MVLRGVGEAVEEEVDSEEREAVVGGLLGSFGDLAGFGWVVEGENRNAGGDGEDYEVFGEWVALAVKQDVEEHNGKEFAGLGEDEGQVIDMGEGSVAEGRSESLGCCNHEERSESSGGGEKWTGGGGEEVE